MRRAPFSITIEGRERLDELLADFEKERGRQAIPAVMWIDADLNDGMVASGVGIGFYLDRHDIEDDIVCLDGIEIVLAVSDEDMGRFVGRTLHHDGAAFVMIDEEAPRIH